jgi:hypothetical protein
VGLLWASNGRATDLRAADVRVSNVRASKVKATDMRATEVRATYVRATYVRATDVRAKGCCLPRRKSISVRSLTKVTSRALVAFTAFKVTSSGAPMPIKIVYVYQYHTILLPSCRREL